MENGKNTIKILSKSLKKTCFSRSLDVLFLDGPAVDVFECSQEDNEEWIWNATDSTVRRLRNDQCLTVRETL